MINNKVGKLITDAFISNLKRSKGIDWSQKNMFDGIGRPDLDPDRDPEKYVMTHCALEDKPRTRHEARFPSWEKENWD